MQYPLYIIGKSKRETTTYTQRLFLESITAGYGGAYFDFSGQTDLIVREEYMDAYLAASGLSEQKGTPLFRTARGKTGQLTENRMSQSDAWSMLQRRAKKAGITTAICNHSWRATGITVFLENGGAIEMAQYMAGHADPRTTKLYDRRQQKVTRSEVERIRYEKKQAVPDAGRGQ